MGIWLELSCTILLISLLPYMTCMQWTSEDKKIFIIFQFTQAHQTCNTFTHTALDEVFALCSRYFQNVKLRLHFVDLTILPLANSISQKTSFLASLVVLNLDVRKFEQFFEVPNLPNSMCRVCKIVKREFLTFKSFRNWFHANSGACQILEIPHCGP